MENQKKSGKTGRITAEPLSTHSTIEIGQAIRSARKQLGLLQAHAAGMCNVSAKFLSKLEQGKESAHLGKTLNVLRSLGLKITLTPSSALIKEKKESRIEKKMNLSSSQIKIILIFSTVTLGLMKPITFPFQ